MREISSISFGTMFSQEAVAAIAVARCVTTFCSALLPLLSIRDSAKCLMLALSALIDHRVLFRRPSSARGAQMNRNQILWLLRTKRSCFVIASNENNNVIFGWCRFEAQDRSPNEKITIEREMHKECRPITHSYLIFIYFLRYEVRVM